MAHVNAKWVLSWPKLGSSWFKLARSRTKLVPNTIKLWPSWVGMTISGDSKGAKQALGPSQGVQGCTREAPRRHQGGTGDAPRRHQVGNCTSSWALGHSLFKEENYRTSNDRSICFDLTRSGHKARRIVLRDGQIIFSNFFSFSNGRNFDHRSS